MVWTKQKVLGHLIVISNTAPCRKETNMAVASMMTCTIGLIWRHMKTLYTSLWDLNFWLSCIETQLCVFLETCLKTGFTWHVLACVFSKYVLMYLIVEDMFIRKTNCKRSSRHHINSVLFGNVCFTLYSILHLITGCDFKWVLYP